MTISTTVTPTAAVVTMALDYDGKPVIHLDHIEGGNWRERVVALLARDAEASTSEQAHVAAWLQSPRAEVGDFYTVQDEDDHDVASIVLV